ncbi:MAG: hypothetical protein RLZZ253_1817, partial [Verrucomicrobiota bacterium]
MSSHRTFPSEGAFVSKSKDSISCSSTFSGPYSISRNVGLS